MAKIPVGLQLYTLRDETGKDFIGTLQKVADIGYKYVEFAGYNNVPAKELRKALDDLGLKATSSHIGHGQLENQFDKEVEYLSELGIKYAVVPWAPIDDMIKAGSVGKFMESLTALGEKVKNAGFSFLYHNHDFEFKAFEGTTILDYMWKTIPTMGSELDLYWVKKAGLEPKDYLQSLNGRAPLVHVKDMAEDGFFAEVGHGTIDYKSVFEVAPELGVQYYIVEQDACRRDPLESVKMSYDYLKSIGIA